MAAQAAHIFKKKDGILALEKYLSKKVSVLLEDETECFGSLQGFDNNMNILVSDAELRFNGKTFRKIGVTVIRGSSVCAVTANGVLLTENPFGS